MEKLAETDYRLMMVINDMAVNLRHSVLYGAYASPNRELIVTVHRNISAEGRSQPITQSQCCFAELLYPCLLFNDFSDVATVTEHDMNGVNKAAHG